MVARRFANHRERHRNGSDGTRRGRRGCHAASEAAVWYSKASPFLGGSGSYADLNDEGMAKLYMSNGRPPGIVQITSASKNTLEITAVSNTYEDIGVRVKVEGVDIVESTIAYDGSIALP